MKHRAIKTIPRHISYVSSLIPHLNNNRAPEHCTETQPPHHLPNPEFPIRVIRSNAFIVFRLPQDSECKTPNPRFFPYTLTSATLNFILLWV